MTLISPKNPKLVMDKICDIEHFVKTEPQCKNKFTAVLSQLLQIKYKPRLVCKNCHGVGHNTNSKICKFKIEKNNLLKQKIKNYMLSQDCLSEKINDELFDALGERYEISKNKCKNLYNEISPIEWCNRPISIDLYIQQLQKKKCHQCNEVLYNIQKNTHRIWKGNTTCNSCWSEYQPNRELFWKKINTYKKLQCYICSNTKKGERYHYDHINMFDKN